MWPLSQGLQPSQAPQLQSLALEGAWAGHDAMLAIDKAVHLRALRLVDTRVIYIVQRANPDASSKKTSG